MTIKNHWGIFVDSESPTTGVLNTNEIAWEFLDYDYICLDCEEYINQHGDSESYDENCPNCMECESYCLDWMECDSSHTKIHGDWIYDTKTKQYSPDKTGEFAMIENESTCQVVWSKYTKRGNLCSPCYPGQVEFSHDGEFLAYTLPPELLYNDDN